MGRSADGSTLEPQTLAVYRTGQSIAGLEIIRALDLRNTVTRSVVAFFADYDVLLTPTLPDTAPVIGSYAAGANSLTGHEWTDRVFSSSPFTPVFNAAGLPAMSLPLFNAVDSGLPVGMQFVADAGREDLLFRLAGQLEKLTPWHGRRPAVWSGKED
ncbi:amidase family protein [Cupriavidus necator]|uniref:amidase family protein n=1 Tax=Cupriavidus necator TaxID=106590 RepID=UPI0039C285C9